MNPIFKISNSVSAFLKLGGVAGIASVETTDVTQQWRWHTAAMKCVFIGGAGNVLTMNENSVGFIIINEQG